MPKFETIQAGDTLWDSHKQRMGNTTMTQWGNWPVFVKEVDPVGRRALVSWNSNPPQWKSETWLSKLRRTPRKVKDRY